MNDTTGTSSGGLSGSFKKGSSTTIPYGHPHAKALVEQALEVINLSNEARPLFAVLNTHKVPVHVIKGTGESGFSPDLATIYMQAPGNLTKATGLFILDFAKALREAAQEIGGYKTPDPTKDIIAYAEFIHGRNLDSAIFLCQFVKELTNSSYFQDLLDSLMKLGLNGMYKAYIHGASEEDLFMEYAKAYNATTEGQ